MTSTSQAFIELLIQQKELYLKLKMLSDQQREYVASQDAQQLLGLLGARKVLVEQLTQLSQQIAPIREQWRQLQDGLQTDQRDQINQLIDDTQDLLTGIIAADEQDRKDLQAARDSKGVELGKFTHVSAASNAYAANAKVGNNYARLAYKQG
jgi:flagellar hook-associated protein FlgK